METITHNKSPNQLITYLERNLKIGAICILEIFLNCFYNLKIDWVMVEIQYCYYEVILFSGVCFLARNHIVFSNGSCSCSYQYYLDTITIKIFLKYVATNCDVVKNNSANRAQFTRGWCKIENWLSQNSK